MLRWATILQQTNTESLSELVSSNIRGFITLLLKKILVLAEPSLSLLCEYVITFIVLRGMWLLILVNIERSRQTAVEVRIWMNNYITKKTLDIISYPLFADADTGIYPHAASQYHARPKAKRNEFIPCSNNICDILKRFRSFKIPAITLIWPKSSYKHSVTRSYRSGEESGRRSESPLWRHQWRSFVFLSHADDVKREIRLHISRLLTNQKRESARSMG